MLLINIDRRELSRLKKKGTLGSILSTLSANMNLSESFAAIKTRIETVTDTIDRTGLRYFNVHLPTFHIDETLRVESRLGDTVRNTSALSQTDGHLHVTVSIGDAQTCATVSTSTDQSRSIFDRLSSSRTRSRIDEQHPACLQSMILVRRSVKEQTLHHPKNRTTNIRNVHRRIYSMVLTNTWHDIRATRKAAWTDDELARKCDDFGDDPTWFFLAHRRYHRASIDCLINLGCTIVQDSCHCRFTRDFCHAQLVSSSIVSVLIFREHQ